MKKKNMSKLRAISPVDGRYATTTEPLQDYFSEYALIRYRVLIEFRYFIALSRLEDPTFPRLDQKQIDYLNSLTENFDLHAAYVVNKYERVTNTALKSVDVRMK